MVEIECLVTLLDGVVETARKKKNVSERCGDYRRLRRYLAGVLDFDLGLIMTTDSGQAVGVPTVRNLIARLQLNGFSQFAFGVSPIAIVVKSDEAKRSVPFSQLRIRFDCFYRRLLCALPGLGRWRFDETV